jgi:competence protein ComEA
MLFKKFLKDYLSFSKRDRLGLLSLLALSTFIYFLPRYFAKPKEPFPLKERAVLIKAIDTLALSQQIKFKSTSTEETAEAYQYEFTEAKSFTSGELFQFDPNTISPEGWQKLGLNERTAKTINNYRSKGGRFYKPEDLKKIWGMPEGFYERVKDYISIAPVQKPFEQNAIAKPVHEKPEKKTIAININEADTAAFIELPGIGSKLAFRIINFREKLGGFYSVDQVAETYGLPDSTFQKIKFYLNANGVVKKINVNTATKDELKIHPYIKWNLANAIVEYRNQHGNFKSLNELKNIAVIDEATFEKIAHYLSL